MKLPILILMLGLISCGKTNSDSSTEGTTAAAVQNYAHYAESEIIADHSRVINAKNELVGLGYLSIQDNGNGESTSTWHDYPVTSASRSERLAKLREYSTSATIFLEKYSSTFTMVHADGSTENRALKNTYVIGYTAILTMANAEIDRLQ